MNDIFWEGVQSDEENNKFTKNLIFEKNIYLDDDIDGNYDQVYNKNVLIIGLCPHNRMKVYARIESRTECGGVLHLDAVSLMNLMDCIDRRFSEKTVSNKGHDEIDGGENKISLQYTIGNRYKITVGDKYLKLSLTTLLNLKRKYSIIQLTIVLFEDENYEPQLYNLLNHFCYEANERIVIQALHRSHNINKNNLIYEIWMLECSCFSKSFVLEITDNCLDWFVRCVRLFIRSLTNAQMQ